MPNIYKDVPPVSRCLGKDKCKKKWKTKFWEKRKLQATQTRTQKITSPCGNYFTMHKGIVKQKNKRKRRKETGAMEEQTSRQPKQNQICWNAARTRRKIHSKDNSHFPAPQWQAMPQFNMQRQAILKYLKDIMLLRTHYTADRGDGCGCKGRTDGWLASWMDGWMAGQLHSNEIIPCKIIIIK